MHATYFYFGAALLTALCQTATDICTKAATREAEERLILATQWTVGAGLLWLLCLAQLPALLFPSKPLPNCFTPASGRCFCYQERST
jgi:hypothetical protein